MLNLLQTWNLTQNTMDYDQSKSLSELSKKNADLGPFDLAGRLLSGSVFRGLRFDEKMDLYFNDYQLMPPFVQVRKHDLNVFDE